MHQTNRKEQAAVTASILFLLMVASGLYLFSDDSEGLSRSEPCISAYDETHTDIQSGSFAESIKDTYSVTTETGERFKMDFEFDLNKVPSYLSMSNAKGTFNFTISMDLSQTPYKDQGLIVYVGDYRATLVPLNNFKAVLMDEATKAALSSDVEYTVSYYTVGGVPTTIDIDTLSNASMSLVWESTGDASFICFESGNGIIESRYILPGEPIGTIPDETDRKGTFLGWFDSFGNEVSEDTVYDTCNDLIISERWKGGFGPEVFIITTILTLNVYICLYLIFSRPRTR